MLGKNKRLAIILIVLSLVYMIGIIYRVPYFIGPPESTQWRYMSYGGLLDVSLVALVGILSIFTYYLWSRVKKNNKKVEVLFLLIVFALNIMMLLSVINVSEGGLSNIYGIINSRHASGYFTQAVMVKNPIEFIDNYDNKMYTLEQHVSTHPPGAVLFAWKVNNMLIGHERFNKLISNKFMKDNVNVDLGILNSRKRTGFFILSVVITFLAGVMPFFVYYLSKSIFGVIPAKISGVLWIVVPAQSLFFPSLDIVYALFSVSILLCFYQGIMKKNILFFVVAGLVLSAGLFFTFAFLFFFPFIVISYIFMIIKKKIKFTDSIRHICAMILPIIVVYVSVYTVFNYDIVSTFISSNVGVSENLRNSALGSPTERKYGQWIFFNIYEFFVFLGVPLSVFVMLSVKKALKKQNILKYAIFLSYIIAIILLDLSGITLAEVGRIWIFLTPLLLVYACDKISEYKGMIYLLFILQILILIVQKISIRLIDM